MIECIMDVYSSTSKAIIVFNILIGILAAANSKLPFWKIRTYSSNSKNSRKGASHQRRI